MTAMERNSSVLPLLLRGSKHVLTMHILLNPGLAGLIAKTQMILNPASHSHTLNLA